MSFRETEVALKAPFPGDRISWRVGSTNGDKTKGMALAYIDARDVMDRLDEVVGAENWQCRYSASEKKTVCEIDIWVEGRGWVTKADGAGDSDVEAEKGALSDALKRSAVRWGIGRYLYDLESPWVKITAFGRSYKIDDSEQDRLARIAGGSGRVLGATTPATSGAVLAACAAIDLCKTPDDMDKWVADNGEAIKALPLPEAQAIRRHFGQRQEQIRRAA